MKLKVKISEWKLSLIDLISLVVFIGGLIGSTAIILFFLGKDILGGLELLFVKPFTTTWGWGETIMRTGTLVLMSLGVVIPLKAGFWNVGADGQGYIGALVATGIGIFIADSLPVFILWPLIIAAAFVVGGGWALIAGVLKVKREVNEILTTIMLNFVAIWIVHYFCLGPWHEAGLLTKTYTVHPKAQLPIIIPGTRAHAGVFIALAAFVLCFFLLNYTTLGFQIKVKGRSHSATQYGGINVAKVVLMANFMGGGLAALGGVDHILGVHYYMLNGMYRILHSTGYLALGMALLGKLNPIYVSLVSFLFSGVLTGAHMLAVRVGLPGESHLLFVGILLYLALLNELLRKYLKRRQVGGFV